MSRCCLRSLEGISSIKTLQELYLSFNEISDIGEIGLLPHLEILDLEGFVVALIPLSLK